MRKTGYLNRVLVAGVFGIIMLLPRMSRGEEFQSTAPSTNEPALKASESNPGPRATTYEGSGPQPEVGFSEGTVIGETRGDHSSRCFTASAGYGTGHWAWNTIGANEHTDGLS